MLTVVKVKNLTPKDKPYKVYDGTGSGLYVLVMPNGSKLWRLDYRLNGKRKTMSLGRYPEISLAEAREKAFEIKKILARGEDPMEVLKKKKERNSFEQIAEEWFESRKKHWTEKHARKMKLVLGNYIFPFIGKKEISELETKDILVCVQKAQAMGRVEIPRRIIQVTSQVFRYAILAGKAKYDIAQPLRGMFPAKETKHFPATTDPEKLKGILRAIWNYHGNFVVASALKIVVYTFQRPSEICSMRWTDINLKKTKWSFIVSKTGREHIVPLARQVIDILKNLRDFVENKMRIKNPEWVFPSLLSKTRHINPCTLRASLLRIGIDTKNEQSIHGFRAVARTLLHEELQYEPDIIEVQLSHVVPDRLGTAYNRAKFLKQREKMMQDWADYIDKLRES